MGPRTRDDTTVQLEAATVGLPARLAWHERPPVLIASAVVGVVGLVALVFSVVDMSEDSTHPTQSPPSAMSTPAQAPSPTAIPTVAAPPPVLPSDPAPAPVPATSVPDFAAGPTAEMLIPPTTPAFAPPAPVQLPRWLRRLLHQDDGQG